MSYDLEWQQLNAFLNSIELANFPLNWKGRILDLFEFIKSSNNQFNLTRITHFSDFLFKHIADSLMLRQVMPEIENRSLMIADVGCGAGFPGIPLALTFSESVFIEIESNKKKGSFVESLTKSLKLSNCRVVICRARELGRTKEYKEKFDLVVARAVKETPYLIRECRQLLKPNSGCLVAYKTPSSIVEERMLANREAIKYRLHISESSIIRLPNRLGDRQFFLIRYKN